MRCRRAAWVNRISTGPHSVGQNRLCQTEINTVPSPTCRSKGPSIDANLPVGWSRSNGSGVRAPGCRLPEPGGAESPGSACEERPVSAERLRAAATGTNRGRR